MIQSSLTQASPTQASKTARSLAGAAALAAATLLTASAAQAAGAGVKLGVLNCNVSSGWGFIFGSSKSLNCTYAGSNRVERYIGHINKFGVDIGYQKSGVLVWGVFAPTGNIAPGALAGNYGGVTAGATVGLGAAANGLIGGSTRTISLQPLSIEGTSGLNVAAGIASISLRYVPHHHHDDF